MSSRQPRWGLIVPVLAFFVSMLAGCKQEEGKLLEPSKEDQATNMLDTQLKQLVEEFGLVGMSVALIHEGTVGWEKHYGKANVGMGTTINGNTKYRIASISKTITALAVMQLKEQGKLDIDVDIATYLGWKVRNPTYPDLPITLRQLMSHTSSLRDGTGYYNFSKEMIAGELSIKELFLPNGTYFTEDLFADHQPGEFFTYTNCSWGLVASIIEKVSGLYFDAYCQKYIFEPMKLTATFDVTHLQSTENIAALYRFENEEWKAQVDDYRENVRVERRFSSYVAGQNGLLFGPQGSLRASTNDLVAFAQLFFDEGNYRGTRILSPESIKEMQTPEWTFVEGNGDTWEGFFHAYGLGVHCILNKPKGDIIFPDRKMIGHPGIAYGLLSDLYIDPSTKTGIIFITNGSKKAYTYGTETSFYGVEEAVFKEVYPFLRRLESENKR